MRTTVARLGVLVILGAATGLGGALAGSLAACSKPKCPVCPEPRTARSVAPPDRDAPRTVTAERHAAKRPSCAVMMATIRRQAEAHHRLSELLGWYGRTRGEAPRNKTLFVGKAHLFSRKHLAYMKDCIAQISGEDAKRAAAYLRAYIAREYIVRKTAKLQDAVVAAELRAKTDLPWRKGVSYRDLPVLLSQEKLPQRRAQIHAARAALVKRVINPALESLLVKKHELSQMMAYKSYLDLATYVRGVDLPPLVQAGAKWVSQTEAIFKTLLSQAVQEATGRPLSSFRRADHDRVFRGPNLDRYLPKELMMPAFEYFLRGIGLSMNKGVGTHIKVDAEMHPGKSARAACYSISVPKDVRVSVKPAGGLLGWRTYFHEGGHAFHFAAVTPSVPWEFRQLGNASATEAYAELFARAWSEPSWLERYRQFVTEVNQGKHRDLFPKGVRPRRVPVMSRQLMAKVIRNRLAYDLYLMRRYGYAKLIYEAILHNGAPSIWKGAYDGQTADRRKAYQDLMSKAYGYQLTDEDATVYLSDVDDLLYAADYARAFVLADMLHEHLRQRFGDKWFGKGAAVGTYLKGMWHSGNKFSAEGIAKQIGYATFDYKASHSRLLRLIRAATELSKGKSAARPVRKPGCGAKVVAKKPAPCRIAP